MSAHKCLSYIHHYMIHIICVRWSLLCVDHYVALICGFIPTMTRRVDCWVGRMCRFIQCWPVALSDTLWNAFQTFLFTLRWCFLICAFSWCCLKCVFSCACSCALDVLMLVRYFYVVCSISPQGLTAREDADAGRRWTFAFHKASKVFALITRF